MEGMETPAAGGAALEPEPTAAEHAAEPQGTDWKAEARKWVECSSKFGPVFNLSYDNGARAIIAVGWKPDGIEGHVFIAEQVGSRTIFVDPQTGSNDCSDAFMQAMIGSTQILRIDDNDLTELAFEAVRKRRR